MGASFSDETTLEWASKTEGAQTLPATKLPIEICEVRSSDVDTSTLHEYVQRKAIFKSPECDYRRNNVSLCPLVYQKRLILEPQIEKISYCDSLEKAVEVVSAKPTAACLVSFNSHQQVDQSFAR